MVIVVSRPVGFTFPCPVRVASMKLGLQRIAKLQLLPHTKHRYSYLTKDIYLHTYIPTRSLHPALRPSSIPSLHIQPVPSPRAIKNGLNVPVYDNTIHFLDLIVLESCGHDHPVSHIAYRISHISYLISSFHFIPIHISTIRWIHVQLRFRESYEQVSVR